MKGSKVYFARCDTKRDNKFPASEKKRRKKKAVATLTDYLNVVPNVQFTAANETGAFNEAVAAGSLSHSLQERKLCLLGHSE